MSGYVKFLASGIVPPAGSLTCAARARVFWAGVLLSMLSACGVGGGGGSGSPPPVTVAPSNLQYPTAPAFVVNTAIAPLTPTVVGTVTSYSVSPLERLVSGWTSPTVRTWPLRVLVINAVQMGVVLLAGAVAIVVVRI
jgi:hypothetical protein